MADPQRTCRTATGSATLIAAVAGLLVAPVLLVFGLEVTDDDSPSTGSTPPPAPTASLTSDTSQASPTPEPSETETTEPKQAAPIKRMLFFGDSLFIGGGYTVEYNSMAKIASRRLDLDRSWVNGGGGTGYVTANPEYDLGTFLQQIDAGAFDVPKVGMVVLEGGNNDRGYPVKRIQRNAGRVIRRAMHRHPGAKVVVLGPIDSNEDHSDLKPIMRAVRKAARNNHVPFINGVGWLDGHYDLIGPDYDHPIPAGHRILGRKLAKALRANGA